MRSQAAATSQPTRRPPEGDFRIDRDQKFNATTNFKYVFEKRTGAWAALSWRYDSGLVGAVGSLDDALALTANQQTAIGFFCGDQLATRNTPVTRANCTASHYGATRLGIPAEGTAGDVANPPRVASRHLFDLGIGVDNLQRTDRTKLRVRFSVINLTNKDALYTFLSTFNDLRFHDVPRCDSLFVGTRRRFQAHLTQFLHSLRFELAVAAVRLWRGPGVRPDGSSNGSD